jgi:hypothetical protein
VLDGPFEHDIDGLLYNPRVRESIEAALPGEDRRASYEGMLALRRTAHVIGHHLKALDNLTEQDHPVMRMLMRLYSDPDGVALRDLVVERGDEAREAVIEAEREGLVVQGPGPGHVARLTPIGRERMEDLVRRAVQRYDGLIDGISVEQMAILRHVCLTLIRNYYRHSESPDVP